MAGLRVGVAFWTILAIPTQFWMAVLAGLLAPRRVGWLVIVAGLLVPWTLPQELTAMRGFSALLSVAILMRAVDLARENPPRPWMNRALHAVSPSDTRRWTPCKPSFDAGRFVVGVVLVALAAGAFGLAWTARAPWSLFALTQRWVGAMIGLYAAFEGLDRLLQITYAAFGFAIEPVQRNPAFARTVAEFWGSRWNSIVHRWLASVTFRRIARRRPLLGVVGAFIVSAAVHAYIILPALGWRPATWMAGFFVIHGSVVLIERRLRVVRWPLPAAHTWTIGWFLLTMPLFMEPFLGLFSFPPALDFIGCRS